MNNKELIGYVTIKEDFDHTDAGFACAAWFESAKLKAGKYPLYGCMKSYDKDSVDYAYYTVPGIITAQNFASYFCGNFVAENPRDKEAFGKETEHSFSPYGHSIAAMILKEKSACFKKYGYYDTPFSEKSNEEFELLPEWKAEVHGFTSSYDGEYVEIDKIVRVKI